MDKNYGRKAQIDILNKVLARLPVKEDLQEYGKAVQYYALGWNDAHAVVEKMLVELETTHD